MAITVVAATVVVTWSAFGDNATSFNGGADMKRNQHWLTVLVDLSACDEAVTWARKMKTEIEAWGKCERGDWMLWFARRRCKYGDELHRKIVMAAAECASLARSSAYNPTIFDEAISAAKAWSVDPSAENEVRARAAAFASYRAHDVVAYAAASSVYAHGEARAVTAAADKSYHPFDAPSAAAAGAAFHHADAARAAMFKQCARIVRMFIPAHYVIGIGR